MMPAQRPLTSGLALLLLLGMARAGPFSPRSNMTLPAPRPPPQPGGRSAEPRGGIPSSELYEHTVEGGEKQVVFTHRINLPPSAGCGCPPGTEPPAPASEVQALRVRLEVLEELVKGLKEQCAGGCCPAAAQASTGQTDVRSLCSLHGVFDLSRCACSCEPGWAGPTCSDPDPAAGPPPSSPPAASGSCPDDCNDQGRCVRGRCVCFAGYTGPSCGWPACPGDCHGRGRCVQGVCVCRPGFAGEDCGLRACPRDCGDGGRCVDGRCVCHPGYAGEDCGARTCPRDCRGRGRCEDGECICDAGYGGDDCGLRRCPGDCSQRGRCEGGVCVCWPGYAGPDCGARACPRGCRGRGRCEDGVCVCDAGYGGEDCGLRRCPGDCGGRGRCEGGRCVCHPGYTGRDCGARACPGDCRGRGRCADGRCVCHPGFAGEDCGSRRCPGDCRGRGRCEDGRCVCDAGYEGEDCGLRGCPGGCRGRGQCRDGHCVCDDGFAGEDCGLRRCPRDCSQRGECRDGVCACWAGFAGEDCGLRACPADCHRRGRCEDGRCVCDPGYSGPACAARTCPADCRGRGRCVQGACVCHAGYGGEDCGQEEPPASGCPGGCGPRALCRAGQCVCVEGFRGPDCAIQTCPGDCGGRGECREGSCVCPEGYAGEDCGEEVPAIEGMRMHLLEETTVRTEWTRAPGPVDAYEIQFIPTPEGASPPFTARVPSSASAYDQRGLAPGQEYQVTVRALRGTNWGPPASKTITTMIDGPQDLRVVAVTPTTLELSWLRPQAEVDRFVVSYVSAGNQRVRLEVPAGADGALLPDLMPGVEYVVTVTAERGRAVSYPASVRANTAPGHYTYPEVRPPAPPPRPRPRPPARPRPPRPSEEGREEPGPGPGQPQPPRRPWGNLTAELGRFRGSVPDLERQLRAHGYPLRANQTYAAVARLLHDYLQRRRAAAAPAGSPAPPPRRPRPTASPDGGTWKPASTQGGDGLSPEGTDGAAVPRHPKPEVLGSAADGSLLVSLNGLRGHFERVVLRWQPQPPADGPGGELTVPGSARTVSLPRLRPGTTYHVEVHGVRAGQTSKSYAFITTTGSSPSDLLGAIEEPPPSGPSTTQGAQAPGLQQRPQELGELRVLSTDKAGRLRVAWMAQPDTFAHFQLGLRVPDGPGSHDQLLPGDVRQALLPSPPAGAPYELSLRGVTPEGKPSAPLIYKGIMDRDGETPATPRLGELVVTDVTSSSLLLYWTVPEGEFDSFVIQYKDRDQPRVLPVEGPQRSALVTNLDVGRKYKFLLYGLVGKKRHGPRVAEAKILPHSDPSPAPPRLGALWVTDPTPQSLRLAWTVPEGQFDSFVVQYRDRAGRPHAVPVEGPERSLTVSPLDADHQYRFALFGIANQKRHGPLTADGTTAPGKREEPWRPAPEQPRLGELVVTGATPDALRLAWTVAQGDFDSFMIQYKDAQGQPRAVPVRAEENSVTVPGLEPDRKYKMHLYGLHGRQRMGPVSVVATTAAQQVEATPSPTEPSAEAPEPSEEPLLGELTVTGSSPDSLRLSWTVPEGHFDHFLVQYKNGDGQPKAVRVPGHEDGVTLSGLEPDHKYKMHLYGFHDGQRQGPISATGVTAAVEVTPSPPEPSTEAPETPEEPLLGKLMVTGSTPDSLSLSWTVPRGHLDSFTIQYKDRDGRPQVVRVGGEEREVTVQGLEPGRKYKMHLYGLHRGRRVGPTSTVGLTARPAPDQEAVATQGPPTVTPEPPLKPRLGELTVTGSSPDSLRLSWTVPEGHFDHFLVQYKNGDGQPKAVRVPGHEDGVTLSGLEPDHKYKMHLYGFHDGQRQGPISATGVTAAVEATPSPPEPSTEAPETPEEPLLGELTVTGSSPDSLSLSWTVPRGHLDSFTVQYKDRDGRPQVVRVGGEEREVTVQGLEPGRKYKMHLYGLHGGRRVGPASTVSLTALRPDATPLEPRLGELTVTGVTPSTVRLTWTVPEGQFDSFEVQYEDRDGQLQAVPVAADQREVTVPGLEPAREYRMLVYGLRGGQRLGPLSVGAVTAPLRPAPATESPQEPLLGELTVTEVTPDSVGLAWTVPQGEFDSFLVQYKDRDGQLQAVPVAADQREATIRGLEPNRKYKLLLFGIQEGKRRSPVSVEAKTAAQGDESSQAPPRLGELWVADRTPDSLRLSWTVAEGHFDSFMVQFKDRDGPRVVPVEGGERSVTVVPLDSGRKYRFLLYGLLGKRRHGPLTTDGTTETRSVGTKRPPKPRLGENLQVTSVTPDSVGLAWTVLEGQFDSFVVQYKGRDGQPQVVPVEGSLREARVSGLDPARRYKLLLFGLHEGQRVGPVSAIALTAPREDSRAEPTAPNPPEPERPLGELTVAEATPHTLHLSWTLTEGPLDSFELQYTNQGGQLQVVSLGGDQNDVTLSGLESDHRYLVKLYGFRGRQRLGPIQVEALTARPAPDQEAVATQGPPTVTPEPPLKPRLGELTVTGSSPDSLRLSWTVPEGHFDHFLVQYKNGDGQPKAVRVLGHEDRVTLSGLEPDHKYKMHLYGFHDGQRQGPISATGVTAAVEATPTPPEPNTEAPEAPEEPLLGELTVTGSSPDSLSLSWTVPRGHLDSFTVQYKDRDGRPQVVRVGGEEREVTVQGLEPGRKYKMHLYGLHGGRRVGPASIVGLTARPAPDQEAVATQDPPTVTPEPPLKPRLGELTVTGSSPDSLRLSWTVPEGHFDHFLVQYKNGDGQPKAVRVPGHEDGVTLSGLEPDHKYKMHLYGFHDGQRQGPISATGVTAAVEATPSPLEPSTEAPEAPEEPLLGELTVTGSSPDSLSLSWTVPRGHLDSFTVQYKDRDGRPQVVRVGGEEREVTVQGLEPGRKYKMHLYGLHGRRRVGPTSTVGLTAPLEQQRQPPPRLGELTVTGATPGSLRLAWTVAQGLFDSFLVQYKDTSGQPRAVPVAADRREATIEGLEPGRKYKFLLYGLLGGQRLGPASVLGVTAPAEDTPTPWEVATQAPEAPEGPRLGELAVSGRTPDSVRLSWTVAQGPFDSFVVQYWDADRQPQALLVGGDQSQVHVSGLEPSTPYRFFLYGLRAGARLGPISAEGTTGSAPAGQSPGEPGPRLSQLSVTDVTTSSLRLGWEAPPGAFDSFLLRYGVPSASTLEPHPPLLQREVTVPGTRRSAVLRDLRPGTLYGLTLYGLRGPHKADSVQGTARTLSPVLESPRDLQFSEIGENSAKVSWMPPPSRVDSFKVSYQLVDGGEPQSIPVGGQARTQTLRGLTPGAHYEVTVVSLRGFEESEPLTGFLTTVPDGPTQLRALNLTEDAARLSWKPPQAPVDTYDVRVAAPGAPPLQAWAPGSAVDHPLQGLELHTNYTATVRGLRGPNLTSPASITFTTGLQGPQDLEAKEVTPRTALLTWTKPQVPPTGYLLAYDTPGGQTQEILLPGGVASHQLLGLYPSTTYRARLWAVWGESLSPPVPTSFTTGGLRVPFPRDCGEEMQNAAGASRATTIFLEGNRERPLHVFCDMETDGGGWLVFQRRMDGHTDFWRDWEDYAHGFGNISGEFWLGNEALHSLTTAGDYSLRVDLRAGGKAVFAQYDSFRVDSAADYYRLHLEGYQGTAGDSMSYHSGSVFSARDRDPNNLLISCAVSYRGGWWYKNCHYANLNGLYGSTVDHQGVSWYHWKGFEFSVPFTEMKLRPRGYRAPASGG